MISIVLGRGGDDAALIFPASDFACRGIALPRAESQDLMTIVDGVRASPPAIAPSNTGPGPRE